MFRTNPVALLAVLIVLSCIALAVLLMLIVFNPVKFAVLAALLLVGFIVYDTVRVKVNRILEDAL